MTNQTHMINVAGYGKSASLEMETRYKVSVGYKVLSKEYGDNPAYDILWSTFYKIPKNVKDKILMEIVAGRCPGYYYAVVSGLSANNVADVASRLTRQLLRLRRRVRVICED